MPRLGEPLPIDDPYEEEIEEEDDMTPRPVRRELREAFSAAENALVMLRDEGSRPYSHFWDTYEVGGVALQQIRNMQERLTERRFRE